ncbi:hypothetical protein [Delftia phage PhiW-14]|uniref:Uncharacterized protein n=1 Tax=Delftia phage PhiW-14 TaxID=665032 RepID=C9DG30_BPW14|nr:hypothetical protein DP-phiW-14_gp059 [Delftia phage PhiW-14]ACV50081.1 hypothetical protein [Delftia phage PhiW-14]
MKVFYLTFPIKDIWDGMLPLIPKGSTLDVIGIQYVSQKDGDKEIVVALPGWQ